MTRYHIHIQGRVQGVGFRPFIFREARNRDMKGWVSNTKDGVHIEMITKDEKEVRDFCDYIRAGSPPQSRIERLDYWEVPYQESGAFEIRLSSISGIASLPLTPDFAVCNECRMELFDPGNRRYLYPFITCTNCGPRFSIIRQVPYDREQTTMGSFQMCGPCSQEYSDPSDRRFFSQTNSCRDCPVELSLFDSEGHQIGADQESLIRLVCTAVIDGKIVAVKGIGGFLLMADATSSSAIKNLRTRKKRPAKPFALMYPDAGEAEKDVIVHDSIRNMWESPESPIILCSFNKTLTSGIKTQFIAPDLKRLGIMMPYAPLFLLLMEGIKKPVIATSGNITESPIIYDDQEALEYLSDIADYVLIHNREILVPQDDSVIQYSHFYRQRIVLRRSRGMAPAFSIPQPLTDINESLLSMGAMLKSTFGMYHQDRIYISQYLGNTETLSSQENYEKVFRHLTGVLDFHPSKIVVDMHPDYPATMLGERLSKQWGIPLLSVQHHEAHAFAVLGENDLLQKEDILCMVWDGTGLGHDRQIWGGEFFRYKNQAMERIAHLDYFDHLAGDRMSREPRIALLSLVIMDSEIMGQINHKFTTGELMNYRKILSHNLLKTSSVGRLFDAVASLLDLADFNTYEGEAAMYLEAKATEAYLRDPEFNLYYRTGEGGTVNIFELISTLARDVRQGSLDREFIALKFHVSMVKCMERIARYHKLGHLAFSGGVFQNGLLIDLIHRDLGGKFKLYFHRELSPNDENISYGQMMKYYISQKLPEYEHNLEHKNFK